ncbi:alpha/beta fold hydrolase [Streptomyces melanosporofaciens]|uniref:Pimeloyl-ACP methyl ester carboxylesterase n=1 Tax=Streptomyces melanosporofaciens TaxID=67327 RepID=A0A1H4KKQ5_STRMJ|nr:alpha/beta fold hydrolase [Streptomyces melanosporofaciens]SEB58983.1 Pimeloyl-ACP methyl ester carboxylesterase [Streptomyces melanosporofaciens]
MNQDAGRREWCQVAVGHPTIGYLDAGPRTGEALVLLHSLGTDHRLWRHQIDALAAEYRVIAPDSRGHGRSSWAARLDLGEWLADLDRVLDHARVDRAVIAGLSMGGVQALAFAGLRPERTRGLVVADSFAELDPDVARAKTDAFTRRARQDGMAALADWYVAETFTATSLPVGAEMVREAMSGIGPEALAASAETCFGARLGDVLGGIGVPALVLWGERDMKTPRELSELVASRIKGARFEVIPEAGHLSAIENPGEFTRVLADFVAERQGDKR